MKKRLRKKRRLGEFREDCFELSFELSQTLSIDAVDTITDRFIEVIESRGLQFGGGGNNRWHGIVQGLPRRSVTESDRQFVLDWLNQHPNIVNADAGPLRDVWHGLAD